MRCTPIVFLALALLLACKDDDAESTTDSSATDSAATESSATAGSTTAGSATAGSTTAGSTTAASTTSEDPTSGTTSTTADPPTGSDGPTGDASTGSTGSPGCQDGDGDGFGVGCAGGDDCDDAAAKCTQDCIDGDGNGIPECNEAPGSGVMLFTGAMGGGPPTDLYVDSLESLYMEAGFATEVTSGFPADFVKTTGTMVLLNPREDVGQKVRLGTRNLLLRGGRVVLIMEHCKNGCFGNAEADNALLADLGSSLRLAGDGGAPLSNTPLTLAATPVTEGLSSIVAYYSGSLTVGAGVALGTMDGGAGDVVIGYETLYNGDIVVAADSSIFGYMLKEGDNEDFVVNLANSLLGGP